MTLSIEPVSFLNRVYLRLSLIFWVMAFTTLVESLRAWQTPASFIDSHSDGDRLEPPTLPWLIVRRLPLLEPKGRER